ncbi:acetylornithine deacetylase [Mycolicibacterium murale]|uniref:Acetylornithine deacetylase n=1 Tax=Mycolicibacterium murale TaxID=182220 RepID=A0A7I9WJJ7_9MYCO|nr:ArgE/DapE family deacylase [Mycolicibacterium murale]MCV7183989.1 ArgE/DapE family deacylase [Mycolicibacterium murale]GFG57538.1 acetylornithine deacetylase [Mycolicibacterium murale]
MSSRTIEDAHARVSAQVDALADDMITTLSEVIAIPSVNPKYPGQMYDDVVGAEGRVSRLMAELYADAGAEVECWAVEPGRDNAVGSITGRGGGRSLIFNGHVDVVPPGNPDRWTADPFSGRIDDDRVWGRGASDMKAGLVAQAFAAKAIRMAGVSLRGDLIVQAVVGEEVMDHECGVSSTFQHGYRAEAAVVAEPSGPTTLAVIPVTPGLLWFSVTVRGKATHSSMRGQTIRAGGGGAQVGVNAIDKGMLVFQAMARLEDEWAFTKKHPLFAPGHFTIHPGVVQGGPHGVLVPFVLSEYMTIEYCIWYPPQDDPETVKAEVEAQIEAIARTDGWLRENPPVVEWKLNWPANDPGESAADIVAAVSAAHERVAGNTPYQGPAQVAGFCAVEDCSFFTAAGIPSISYGPGDLRVAHADDEYCLIDEVRTAARTYAALALDWCGIAE